MKKQPESCLCIVQNKVLGKVRRFEVFFVKTLDNGEQKTGEGGGFPPPPYGH